MRVLTTLAERDYFYGLSALINSAVHFGPYVDKVVVGYRGPLPSWLPTLKHRDGVAYFKMTENLEVSLHEMTDEVTHMVHQKPRWCLKVMDELAPDATTILFMDSDIVVNNSMPFYDNWSEQGVGVCGDVNFHFSAFHPIRQKWSALAESAGRPTKNTIEGYYNSGFLLLRREYRSFLVDWNQAIDIFAPYSGDTSKFRVNNRLSTVLSANQDGLNLALMITDCPIALLGPDAMGFEGGIQLMYHILGQGKSWRKNYLLSSFDGRPPALADQAFWEFANGQKLQPYSSSTTKSKLLLIKVLRFFGRFYRGKQT